MDKFENKVKGYAGKQLRRKRWQKIVAILAALVVFVTTYILTMPASTMRGEIFCGMAEHIHTDSCYKKIPLLICENTDENHIHTNACYDNTHTTDILICEKTAHTHSLQCYSNPAADTETEETWQKAFASAALTGDYNHDLVLLARTQLGYKESSANYQVLADGVTTNGYTRYGAKFGLPYADWSALFCEFCLNYAGITEGAMPMSHDAAHWAELLAAPNCLLYKSADSGAAPQPGDLIFLDKNGDKIADRVGIVSEVGSDIITIEGDVSGKVDECTYAFGDKTVLGYAKLPQTLCFKGEDYNIKVSYPLAANIPDNAALSVREILAGTKEYNEHYSRIVSNEEKDSVKFCRLFDISFTVGSKEIEPETEVNINITYDNCPEFNKEDDKCLTVHFAEDGIENIETEIIEQKNGAKSFEFSQNSFSVVANLMLGSQTVSATYYQRVNAIDSTSANYLIVSAEGYYALPTANSGSTSVTGKALKLMPVKGNKNYFTVANSTAVTNNIKWRFSSTFTGGSTATNVQIKSVGNNVYLDQRKNSVMFYGSAENERLTYNSTTGTWQIRAGSGRSVDSYYISVTASTGAFVSSTAGTYQRDMLILKEVSAALEIPDDVAAGNAPGGTGTTPVQPTYSADTTSISAAKQGELNLANVVPGADSLIGGSYVSDAATSKIEDKFFSVPKDSKLPSVNDGKVVTDKSVVYGKDDYSAFTNYAEGTFSVALSALAQDYKLKNQYQVKVPIDVVFVLDVSGSMENNKTPEGITRTQAVVNAVNSAMKKIMDDNSENRAGIVMYSSGGTRLLNLDHYTPVKNNFLEYYSGDIYTVTGLKGKKNGTITRTNGETNNFKQGNGTYTQYGIALGAKLLEENTDTTYTATLYPGTDYEKSTTVKRKPVIILLSDGDPTHCNSDYTNVLEGPHYGSGVYTNENNKGVQGYYTILSANYYKRIVGIHYDNPACFFTIGMGIYESGYDDMSKQSYTGDHYKRAVLNPTAASVKELTDQTKAKNYNNTAKMLSSLLKSSYDGNYVATGTVSTHTNLGATHVNVPIIANPYSDSYYYSDGAYFGNLKTEDLQKIFGDIITQSVTVKTYGYLLYEGTSIDIHDDIGEGMEIKGQPILRYNGVNYPLTVKSNSNGVVTYVCNKTVTTADGSGLNGTERSMDLSKILITVTTVSGKQRVDIKIPETVLPVYTPEINADWYYEMLPIRLIYQLGLTAAAKTEIASLSPGQTKAYYTNEWQQTSAGGLERPNTANPYYYNVTYESGEQRVKQYKASSEKKGTNYTKTTETYYNSYDTLDPQTKEYEIITTLGNNGSLTFTNNAPTETQVTLKKADMQGNIITESAAEFEIYKDEECTDKLGTYLTENGTVTVTGLTVDVTYYLVETRAPAGYFRMTEAKAFSVDASGTAKGITSGDAHIKIDDSGGILVYNSDGYELPKTGGKEIFIYSAGILICAFATAAYMLKLRRRKKSAKH